jgi:ribosome-binding factor A
VATREFGREERVGAELQRELARLLRDEVHDPRLSQVTIQEVRVVRDLSYARVFFTLMDRDQARKTEQALNKAAGFLRHRLGERVIMRTVPQLRFEYDHSLEDGMRLSSLIDRAVSEMSPEEQNPSDLDSERED